MLANQNQRTNPGDTLDIQDIRADFPLLKRCTYLNHSSFGPLSSRVQEAAISAVRAQGEGSRGKALWEECVGPLRSKIGGLIGAAPEEVALVRNTVEGLSTVAAGIRWREGDNVVTDDIEFPANIYPWQNLEQRFGVKTRLAAVSNSRGLAETLMEACDSRTRVMAVSFVQFSNGYRVDLKKLGTFCRERGIYLCVDAIQGVGPLSVDVAACWVDFLAAGAHKWLLAPIGTGFLYVRRGVLEDLWPCEVGHLSVKQDTNRYTTYNLEFKPSAERFEGGVLNYAGLCGFNASLDLFVQVGASNVEARVLMLTDYLCEGLLNRGYSLLSDRTASAKSSVVAFRSDRHKSKALVDLLSEAQIVVSLTEGAVRVSPHFYNTVEEIDHLLRVLPKE